MQQPLTRSCPSEYGDIDPALIELLPESVARNHVVLPLRLDGETLTLAAVSPRDLGLRDKLTFLVNKKIALVPGRRQSILAAIDFYYSDSLTDDALADCAELAAASSVQTAPAPRWSQVPSMALPAGRSLLKFKRGLRVPAAAERTREPPFPGDSGMLFYIVDEGQRVLMRHRDGTLEVLIGPRRVWRGWRSFLPMQHHIAHPGEYLVVRYRDGRQEHVAGPAELWADPRLHSDITREEVLQLASKEAVVVYSKQGEQIRRRIEYGPAQFMPQPGEWLHTFTWHASHGGHLGVEKVPKGLVFQKLWLMPDQMYHDVPDVRTADDAVLTIKLMMFFELTDIERMLEATHDPIGDFINAATSDVVDFCGHRTFEEFKKDTGKLNELETYKQLTVRATQNGYRINKVVYRGYGAPDRLQAMHDQAIEARTKLQLERATEEQAQGLEDYKLNAQMNRATRRRTEQSVEVETEIQLAQKRQEADLKAKEAERNANREQRRRDAESEVEIRRQAEERTRQHLAALKEMGVDLTAFLTQGRADRVIELRGKGAAPHLHLDNVDGEK
jgi:hypothetical protein